MPSNSRRGQAIRQLHEMLAHYETITTSIRTTLDLLGDADRATAGRPRAASLIADALQLDAQRVTGRTNGHGGLGPAAIHAAGAAEARREKKRATQRKWMAKKRAARKQRATGPAGPAGPRRKPAGYSSKVQERRAKTAAFLAQFDQRPRPATGVGAGGTGPLVRRGYLLKHPEGGYVRTDKPFSVALGRPTTTA